MSAPPPPPPPPPSSAPCAPAAHPFLPIPPMATPPPPMAPNRIGLGAPTPMRPVPTTDAAFVKLAEELFLKRLELSDACDAESSLQLKWLKDNGEEWNKKMDRLRYLQNSLDRQCDTLEGTIVRYLAITSGEGEWQPRIVRLARRFGMSGKDMLGLLFVVVWNAGATIPPSRIKSASQDGRKQELMYMLSRACNMAPSDITAFLSSSRDYVRQGVFDVDASFLAMRSTVVKALLGVSLTPEELLSVDKTALGDVLQEDKKNAN